MIKSNLLFITLFITTMLSAQSNTVTDDNVYKTGSSVYYFITRFIYIKPIALLLSRTVYSRLIYATVLCIKTYSG
jgi:hypothetical protein